MVLCSEAKGLHRSGGRKPEVDTVEHRLQAGLVLTVAAGHAHGQNGLSVLEHQRRGQGNPWALSRRDAVGMSLPGVEALETGPEPDARLARLNSAPAAGGGDHD